MCPFMQAHLLSCAMQREGHCKQTPLAYVVSWYVDGPHLVATALGRVNFPCQSHSGSWVLHEGPVPGRLCISCTSQAQAAQTLSLRAQSQVSCASCALPMSKPLKLPGAPRAHSPRWAMHLLRGAVSGCDTSGRYEPFRTPGRLG